MSKKLIVVSPDIPAICLGYPFRGQTVEVVPFTSFYHDEDAGYVRLVDAPGVVIHPRHYTPVVVEGPKLGLATTAELLEELAARARIGGYADYRTVGG